MDGGRWLHNDPIHRAAEVDVEYGVDAAGGSGAIAGYAGL